MRKIILLYGNGSGSGKTSLAVLLLGELPGWAALKVTPSTLYTRVQAEDGSSPPGKDTLLLRAAGADPVIHVSAPEEEMAEAVQSGLDLIPSGRPVLIEGRGALAAIVPSISILVWRPGLPASKGSLPELAGRADLVFVNGGQDEIAGGLAGLGDSFTGRVAVGRLDESNQSATRMTVRNLLAGMGLF
jgi:hypothetical protein